MDFDEEDKLDNETNNDTVNSDSTTSISRQTNRTKNKVVHINVRKWEPELEPDFEVEISESEFREDKNDQTISCSTF